MKIYRLNWKTVNTGMIGGYVGQLSGQVVHEEFFVNQEKALTKKEQLENAAKLLNDLSVHVFVNEVDVQE